MGLEAKGLSFSYSRKKALLKDIDLTVKQGEIVGLTGPSGYGKSTLAKLLAGYEKPHKGEVLLDGGPMPKAGYNPVQLIYQHPEKAVNPLVRMKDALEEAGRIDNRILMGLGIEEEWLYRYPGELSGGEIQRFCVARVFLTDVKIIIADEITTMLDAITQAQIWHFVLDECKNRGLGMLVVTHNMALADRVCSRILDIRKINRDEE